MSRVCADRDAEISQSFYYHQALRSFFFCIKNSLNVKSLSIANKNQAQIATIAETFCLCIDYHVFAQLDLYYI